MKSLLEKLKKYINLNDLNDVLGSSFHATTARF